MAINFPDSPTNAQEVTEGNVTYVYNATKGYWESSEVSSLATKSTTDLSEGTNLYYTDARVDARIAAAAGVDVLADMAALIAKTGTDGAQAFVQSNNNIYVYAGSGWYKIATVQNDSPSAITGVNGTYELAIDGTATTITAVSTDPEGFPLTWSYSTSGLGSIATVSQSDNVFTITPSTDDTDFGAFTLTINATDGVNGAVSTSTNLTLEFIIIVANSKYTSTLIEAAGTGTNLTFVDASTQTHTITNTDVVAGTFSPYRSGGYSTYFDGSSLISAATPAAIGSQDYTIEFWMNSPNVTSTWQSLVSRDYNNSDSFRLYKKESTSELAFYSGGSVRATTSGAGLTNNVWHHIAVVRNSGTLQIYVDGVSKASVSNSDDISEASAPINIGGNTGEVSNYPFTGYIRDMRIVNGTAVYTSNFTPSTEPLTAITNTALLTCHLPYIADGSTNAHAITVTGTVSTKPLTPFDNSEYSEASHGSSGYFDDPAAITTTSNLSDFHFGTGDFTIEAWVWKSANGGNQYDGLFSLGTNGSATDGMFMEVSSTRGILLAIGNTLPGGGTFSLGHNVDPNISQWIHVACTRHNGVTRIFRNGIVVATSNTSYDVPTNGNVFAIGVYGYVYSFNGYISDFRVVKGTAVYTSNFTPPTEPLTAITNTVFLLNPNPSIIDKAQTSNLQLGGNTAGSTTQVKFAGSKSMYFDGSGDYIKTSASTYYDLPADFTIEAWIYPTVLSGDHIIVDTYNSSQAGSYQLYMHSAGRLVFYSQGDSWILQDPSTSSISVNTWNHVAVSRSGTSAKMFVNGTVVDTATNSRELRAGFPVAIGYQQVSGSLYFAGYIQDVRISNGLARYTANFTPPTSSLEG